jgi:hypothetical protein
MCRGIFRESARLLLRRIVNDKKAISKLEEPEAQTPVLQSSRHRDILAITEGRFGKPVTRSWDLNPLIRKNIKPTHV